VRERANVLAEMLAAPIDHPEVSAPNVEAGVET
jgi:hypothetical protein